uniref:Uncharacterized protein n=1 Tax=Biomphalaria glabrata TaxID=6526 RepID=A0A2C9LQA0_BIOGL
MYYRKGTDQHLTFLRNMREAHAMYPFTGKRDKELFDKALAELLRRMPVLQSVSERASAYLYINGYARLHYNRKTVKEKSKFIRCNCISPDTFLLKFFL